MLDAKEIERYREIYLSVWVTINKPEGTVYARRRDTLLKVWALTHVKWAEKPQNVRL